ncbi:unnamed protein product [Calypogeia fissa]
MPRGARICMDRWMKISQNVPARSAAGRNLEQAISLPVRCLWIVGQRGGKHAALQPNAWGLDPRTTIRDSKLSFHRQTVLKDSN